MEKLALDAVQHAVANFKELNNMRKTKWHCDFTIKVDSQDFHVHKIVIAANSGYFKAMLSHSMRENLTSTVDLKGLDAESVEECINFMYTGEASVEDGKYEDLLHAATFLQLENLRNAVVQSLETGLDSASFFLTRRLAVKYDCEGLNKKCDDFALNNFEDISSSQEFRHLDRDYITFLIKSQGSCYSEGAKCKLLIQWINLDIEGRRKLFIKMLKNINLQRVPATYRRYVLEQEPLVYETEEHAKLFTLSLMDSMNITPQNLALSEIYESSNNAILVFDRSSKRLNVCDPSVKVWHKMHEFDFEQQKFSAIAFNRNLYVLASGNAFYRLCYLDENAAWKRMSDSCVDHGKSPPAILGNYIYAVGNYGTGDTRKGERYDTELNEWKEIKDKNLSCSFSSIVGFHGYLYSVGGSAGKQVERYNPGRDAWKFIASLNESRQSPAVAVCNNLLYALGGYASAASLASVETYEPSENLWTYVAPMLIHHDEFRAFVVNGQLFAVGNRTDVQMIECYDEEKNEWKENGRLKDNSILSCASVAVKMSWD